MNTIARDLQRYARTQYQMPPRDLTPHQLHRLVAQVVLGHIAPVWERSRRRRQSRRRAYYLSAEYLMGRLVDNNLLCAGLWQDTCQALADLDIPTDRLAPIEDAALGNGGLGRLAACFLDAAATQKIPLDGYGIRYRCGLFRQGFRDGVQTESPDDWLRQGDPWSVRHAEDTVTVPLGGGPVLAVPYDMPVIGYAARDVATLRLWQAEPVTAFDFALFNDQKYTQALKEKNRVENLSRVLYPNDSTPAGRQLRLSQQYFFASASLQDLLRRFEAEHGPDWSALPESVVIQLNDTHPVIAIPECCRLLLDRGVDFDMAVSLVTRLFCYTNHTVMPEAMERWDMSTLRRVAPALPGILRRLSRRFERELDALDIPAEDRESLSFLQDGVVHMARLACRFSTHINGVAEIHTRILKDRVLAPWHRLYPNKIRNITNGITPRRWLMLANPGLSDLVTRLLGSTGWVTDLTQLEKLAHYADDPEVLGAFMTIKQENKRRLAATLLDREGVTVNPRALLDVQIKRLHEYKRQLLNILCVLELYFEMKEGALPDFPPTLFLFGGKAAPGYARAKGIIQLIHQVGRRIAADPEVNQRLQVVFVTDYSVSYAQQIVAAADLSEQISTAGTEASGTGNMKLMLGGAVTVGTYDGANIEIVAAAGEENNYIFGARVEDIPEDHRPRDYYDRDHRIRRCLDALVDGTLSDGGTGLFRELYDSLLEGAHWHKPDAYYVLGDFDACLAAKKQAAEDYRRDPTAFAAKQWRNLCAAGGFSADRAVKEYAKKIWKVK